MKAAKEGKKDKVSKESTHGYYMYKDGSSRWGTGPYRGTDKPLLMTEELHKKGSPEEKLAWYEEQTAEKK